jgi:hypothetical protein
MKSAKLIYRTQPFLAIDGENPFRAMGKLQCADIRKRDRSPQLNHHQFPHYSSVTGCVMRAAPGV